MSTPEKTSQRRRNIANRIEPGPADELRQVAQILACDDRDDLAQRLVAVAEALEAESALDRAWRLARAIWPAATLVVDEPGCVSVTVRSAPMCWARGSSLDAALA